MISSKVYSERPNIIFYIFCYGIYICRYVLMADLYFFSPKISRISSLPSIIRGSAGIPVPLATRSFFVNVAAIIDAAVTASGPKDFANASLASSSSDLFVPKSASENASNSVPPGIPMSCSRSINALRLTSCPNNLAPSRSTFACPLVQ